MTHGGPTLHVDLAADNHCRNETGEVRSHPHWTEGTRFGDRLVAWDEANAKKSDLVHAWGTVRRRAATRTAARSAG